MYKRVLLQEASPAASIGLGFNFQCPPRGSQLPVILVLGCLAPSSGFSVGIACIWNTHASLMPIHVLKKKKKVYVAQDSHELDLLLLCKCWKYSCVPPHPARNKFPLEVTTPH